MFKGEELEQEPQPRTKPKMAIKTQSGLTLTWKLWRHCCCRYGWYPLFVAPVVTAGCMFSLYSSAGCDFIRVNVGFTPSNEAWNQSTAELGLFFYQSGEAEANKYRASLVDGCQWYEDIFNDHFIEDDRTWQVARIMAYISAISSTLAMVTSWLFVISPLPACFFWPGVLLPALMTSFLSEGSKFLFFDTAICRNTVWFPSGADSLPRVAEECSLGTTGAYSVAGGIIFFLCLILVCLKAPDKRELQAYYGSDHEHDENDLESAHQYRYSERSYVEGGSADMYDTNASEERDHFDVAQPIGDDMHLEEHDENMSQSSDNKKGDTIEDKFSDGEDLISKRLKTLDHSEDKYTAKPKDSSEEGEPDDRYQPTKPSTTKVVAPPNNQTVSESRLHTIERMELLNTSSQSEDMIEKFVNELNVSFQVQDAEEEQNKKREELKVDTNMFCQAICAPSTARSF